MLKKTNCLAVLLVSLLIAQEGRSQEWAKKMFKMHSHDFGTVARGTDQSFAFEITNLYEEDVHISRVRSTCGCTDARTTKKTLKTFEKGKIVATFNTKSYLGHRSATITVVIDKPFQAEVQLNVVGTIRGDIVIEPGDAQLGDVDQGAGKEIKVSILHSGNSSWEILDVRSANAHFEVELNETKRIAGRVAYDMTVRLKPNCPAGYVQDHLTLVTNDSRLKTVTVPVHGRVVPALTVSPASLFMGVLEPGQTVTKRLIVRAKSPFTVSDIRCPNDCIEIDTPEGEKKLHFVPVTFTAPRAWQVQRDDRNRYGYRVRRDNQM